ncbi:MAG: gliding motility-associated C-terminal domain-containing protein [Bacteroidota bacterium]
MQASLLLRTLYFSTFWFILTLVPAQLFGQQIESALGRFSIAFDRGCVPFTVTITEEVAFDETFYDYGDSLVSSTTFTYDTAGQYTIYQVIQEDDLPDGKIDSLQITLRPQVLPEFNIFTCANNRIAVEITDNNYDFYRAYFTSNDSVELLAGEQSEFITFPPGNPNQVLVQGFFEGGSPSCLGNTKTFEPEAAILPATISELRVVNDTMMTIAFDIGVNAPYTLQKSSGGPFEDVTRLDPADDFIDFAVADIPDSPCFRVITNDNCDGSIISSETVCTLHLEVTNSPTGNNLEWEASPVSTSVVQVFRDDSLLNQGFFQQLIDPNLTCNTENCYRLVQDVSISQTICLVPGPIDNLPPPHDLQSTVEGQIGLSWTFEREPPIARYFLSENGRTSTFESSTNSTEVAFSDTSTPLSFTLSYEDDCGNRSQSSNSTSPIFLNQDDTAPGNLLEWNRYEGWVEGIRHYFLQSWDGSQWVEEQLIFSGRSIEVEPEQTTVYRIEALSLEPDPRRSYSNSITITTKPNLFFPNAFTPDGDGLNDIFIPVGKNVSQYNLMIFNRWGEIIFQSDQLDVGWNGVYQGRKAPPGAYTFKVEFGNEEAQLSSQTGTFVLLRN